jgi:hypothetical protein
MITLVYVLCILTSLLCAVLLLRGYARAKVPLLLWAGLCFVGLALSNVVLLIDVNTATPLLLWRKMPALIGVGLLLYGLIQESK